jgi:hypothetical protein
MLEWCLTIDRDPTRPGRRLHAGAISGLMDAAARRGELTPEYAEQLSAMAAEAEARWEAAHRSSRDLLALPPAGGEA